MQDVLTSIMTSDLNGDYGLNEREFRLALNRLKAQDVDANRVSEKLGRERSISLVINATFDTIKEQQNSDYLFSCYQWD